MNDKFIKYWLPVSLQAALIFLLSSISIFPLSVSKIISLDKLWHTVLYAGLSFLLARAFKNASGEKTKNNFRILAIVIAIGYGISDEFHQYFVPLRIPCVIDVIYDSIGALIGAVLFRK
ncbi:MAG: VanZ family protein [Candidatus Omnitrophota bacterium]